MIITDQRLRALRIIQQRPGILARGLAAELGIQQTQRCGLQGLTMWGAGYAKPLISAGLVRRCRSDVGWAALYLTPLGEQVARTGSMPD